MASVRTLARSRVARDVAALAVAAAFGMHAPIVHLVERRPFQYDSGTQADKILGPLRPRLAAGERIGVMIGSTASAENQALWYSAQYALAPAIVTPLSAGDCLVSRAGAKCRLREVKTFIAPPYLVGVASRGLGIAPIGQLGRARLFPGDAP